MGADWHSSAARSARCLFCGAVGTWWPACQCEWARKIREGKLPRPRTVMRGGVPIIECCAELRAAARLAGAIRVAPERVTPGLSVTPEPAPSVTEGPESVTESADERRRRLTRERVARIRARRKEG